MDTLELLISSVANMRPVDLPRVACLQALTLAEEGRKFANDIIKMDQDADDDLSEFLGFERSKYRGDGNGTANTE